MKKFTLSRTVIFGTVFAILVAFSATVVNAAPSLIDKRKPSQDNHYNKAPVRDQKHDPKYDHKFEPKHQVNPTHQVKPAQHQPPHNDYKPHHVPPKPVVVHCDHATPPPQVIVVGQPKKPNLLDKLIYLFK